MPALASLSAAFAKLPGPFRAGVWMTTAGATFTGMMAIARIVSDEIHVFEITFFRSLFGLLFLLPYAMRLGPATFRTNNNRFLLLRGGIAFGTNFCLFSAATLIPLADIAAINFTRPIFTTIAAILILHEVARGRRWWAIAVGFAGAMIVVRPGFADLNLGVAFAFGAVVLQMFNSVLIKYLTYSESPDTIALYQAIYTMPFALIPAILFWTTPSWEAIGWFVFMGFLGTLTQMTLARAYAAADASLVVVLDFLRLPVAALIGFAVFGDVPVIWVWIGGAVIVVSSIFLTRRESRDKTVNRPGPNAPAA